MANGNGSTLTPAKIISICIAITIGVNGWSLVLMQEHGNELAALREEVDRRTDQRYRASDAARDFRLVNFRFERNEENINKCLKHIENHAIGETFTDDDYLYWGDTGHDADPQSR